VAEVLTHLTGHPRVDDFTGRMVGSQVGVGAWALAAKYFDGTAVP
jgi:hypothetical protein